MLCIWFIVVYRCLLILFICVTVVTVVTVIVVLSIQLLQEVYALARGAAEEVHGASGGPLTRGPLKIPMSGRLFEPPWLTGGGPCSLGAQPVL